ncbi:Chromosome partition protein smc [hydrothermal vent metagenome]|uniref:Chromosome partition protein smc n=1 Tax=hydrothermal vent metagenome TaxID=652676 RepID=A0A3B0QKW7_9ZZZZ
MKIKKLTIHGFKSFADRTHFTFPTGTSAIVGPNGCGKSNIVDAIRWVLGEQNARHLRGKLMEDLVFVGSDSRKPVGMAEVTLTLSNESGKAPAIYANFPEIEIQRRLYRSGDSEYYINKVPARLKDIVDLFRDTGIGTKAYSIIEQGQVGWLVTAKPTERRAIFEEAAGINKYKHKKDAALRRLDATRQNLTRVSDIISEVKRQLNSLNRQAKKAERYKVLKDELRSIDLYHSHLQYQHMSAESSALAKEDVRIEDEELTHATERDRHQGSLEQASLEYLQKETEFKDLREQSFGMERLVQMEERQAELARLRSDELKRSTERLLSDIEELKAQNTGSSDVITTLGSELEGLNSLLLLEKRKLSENEAALTLVSSELQGKESALKTEETASLAMISRSSGIKHSLENCIREENSLREREAKIKTEREETVRELAEKDAPVEGLLTRISELSAKREQTDAETLLASEKLKSLEEEKERKDAALKENEAELASKDARLGSLKEMTSRMEGLGDGARNVMLGHKTSAVHGLIADIIETTPGFERAVEAALGERLQYVMVDNQSDAVEAVEYLRTSSKGRGSFMPVKNSRRSRSHATNATLPEGARPLKDEITTSSEYGEMIKDLLGDVLVVDDLKSAADIWEQNELDKTLVTLAGEIIDPDGVITGGSACGSDGGLLQRKGEIKKLTKRTTELENKVASLSSETEKIRTAIFQSKALIETYKEKRHTEELERINLESTLERIKAEKKRFCEQEAELSSEITETAEMLITIKDKKITLSREREDLDHENAELDEKIRVLRDGLSELRTKKESVAQLVTESRVALASSNEKYEHLSKRLEEIKGLIQATARKIETKTGEIEENAREIEAKDAEALKHSEKLTELLESKDALRREEILKEEALNAASKATKEMETEIKKLTTSVNSLHEQRGSLQIKLRELELKAENLCENTIERYGTDIREYTPADETTTLAPEDMAGRVTELREKLGGMGEVSLGALEEFEEQQVRYNFLLEQQTDLVNSSDKLQNAINRINRTTREKFKETFEAVNKVFKESYPKFFRGGHAELQITGEGDILDCGIEIIAQPPGKKQQNINLLSGGEKALTATALVFSIFLIKPSPFCLLDEVDAPLDDANIDRFNGFVKEMSAKSQFILITHNKRTMEIADSLYGITMEEPGVSKAVSVNL